MPLPPFSLSAHYVYAMTKPWAVQKRKKKEQKLLEEKEQQRAEGETVLQVSVSTSHSFQEATAPHCTPSHCDLHPRLVWNAAREVLTEVICEDELPGVDRIYATHSIPPPTTPIPCDFSALRGDSTHPWRTIRQRIRRLLPQHPERRPFPKSLPKRAVTSAPRAEVLAVHDHLPVVSSPSLSPPSPPPVAHAPLPIPVPILPPQTSYGVVQTSLALVCANEKPCIDSISNIFELVWGPCPPLANKAHLVELPADQLVFLCTLAEFVALEPVFAEFLYPAIANFANGWVTHCRQPDSFGAPGIYPDYDPAQSFDFPATSESRPIIWVRAVILSCIILGVPAFGVYTMVVMPLNAQIYTRISVIPTDAAFKGYISQPPGNATLALSPVVTFSDNIRVSAWDGVDSEIDCLVIPMLQEITPLNSPGLIPFRGGNTDSSAGIFTPDILISNLSSAMCELVDLIYRLFATYFHVISTDSSGLYIWPLQGDLSSDTLRVLLSSPPIPLLPGIPLVGILYWTKRELAVGPVWGLSTPSKTIFTAEVAPLLSAPTFHICYEVRPRCRGSNRSLRVATFGGFWTFLNGTFALFFGANVIYFAFGRRPLSALGFVHVFQRRALVRRWHKDFPAIHTEGGTPGSESAGIVAFIRDRLVDLGEDAQTSGEDNEPGDRTTHTAFDDVERGLYVDLQMVEANNIENQDLEPCHWAPDPRLPKNQV
ncbi:hypothetical protein B0H19DRAFT_1373388 [Mycena capillaripes]|nr:hypothetical protein B0H19DRAFT_1373388 [Mycena capillaripes]